MKHSELVLISDYMHYLHLQEPEKVGTAILSKYYGKPSEKIALASEKYSAEEFGEYLDGLLSYFPAEKLTEAIINMHGYDLLRRDKPKHALVLFRHNLARFPESANVYDSMGDGLVALGKTKEAVPYFEKAVELGEMSKHRDLGLFKKNLASAEELE
jgi:tetratricopeptide (TPR) repeat protein